ncbi:MAG: phosphotransferase [Thermoanaerobaculales bacterium]
MTELEQGLETLGLVPRRLVPLAGDASQRRFFRVVLADSETVIAALYPEDGAAQAARDRAIQLWAAAHGLPVPQPLGITAGLTVSTDLGDVDLERALAAGHEVMPLALSALAAFQTCGWDGLANPPFDAAFFRRELAGFEQVAFSGLGGAPREVAVFLDLLASRLAAHPYRLVHRDFHVNNLFLHRAKVWTVDFQDMRAGPDTYDLVSLLRERAGGEQIAAESDWKTRAAEQFAWAPGWELRYLECAAQRGLKVIGTFLRLAREGRRGYLAWLPGVIRHTLAALAALDAPPTLRDAVTSAAGVKGL